MGPVAYAQYSTQTQGLLWLGLISGTVTIEIVCSGRMLDNLASRLSKSNNDIMTPAIYLWLAHPAALLGTGGCILWGLSIDRHWHFMVGELALFICKNGKARLPAVEIPTDSLRSYCRIADRKRISGYVRNHGVSRPYSGSNILV